MGTHVHDVGGLGVSAIGNNIQVTVNVSRTGCGGVKLVGGDQVSREMIDEELTLILKPSNKLS